MNPIYKSIIKLNSNFYFKSIKLAYILIDMLAKLISIITQSASDTGPKGAGLGTVEEAQKGGRIQINKSHAEARDLRVEGGIINYQLIFARGHFEEMATKQRARRWRAACTLVNNNTLETDPINRDSDGDGEVSGGVAPLA